MSLLFDICRLIPLLRKLLQDSVCFTDPPMLLSESIESIFTCFDISRFLRGGVEGECQIPMQSGKFLVTPFDDTTLIDSHKKGRKFHASLLADTQCTPALQLESFLVFFPMLGTFSSPVVCLSSFVDRVNNLIEKKMTCRTLLKKTQKGKKIPCTP